MTSVFLISVLLCLSSGLLAANGAPPSCPPGWTQFGSRCFAFFNQPKTWADAETACIAAGGNLVTIRSAEEHAFLTDFVKKVTDKNTYTWIGGHDVAKDGTWLWSDGSKFKHTNWNPGQPDNYKGGEHCLMIRSVEGNWNDWGCTNKAVFMCSKDLGNKCV